LVIYGGLIEHGILQTRRRNFIFCEDLIYCGYLWILNLLTKNSDFQLAEWAYKSGGYSKVISLGNELLAVINSNFSEYVVLLEVQNMYSYSINVINGEAFDRRVAYSIGNINSMNFIVAGGFIQSSENIFELDRQKQFYMMIFSESSPTSLQVTSGSTNLVIYTFLSVVLVITIILNIKLYKERFKSKEDIRLDNIHDIENDSCLKNRYKDKMLQKDPSVIENINVEISSDKENSENKCVIVSQTKRRLTEE
jgi:hypothetical protein